MHLQQEKRFYPSLRFLTIQPIMTSKYLGCKDVVATWITPSFMYHCQGSLFKLLDRIQNLCWHVHLQQEIALSPRPTNVFFCKHTVNSFFLSLLIIDQFYHKTLLYEFFIVPQQKTTNLHFVKKSEWCSKNSSDRAFSL